MNKSNYFCIMIKLFINQINTILFTSLLFLSCPASADALFGKDNDKDVIWKSGLNLYFKYMEQDESRFGKNDHPVDLDAKVISTALESLKILDEKLFSSDAVVIQIFPPHQLKLLGENLSKGLKNAKPEQDIIFVMERGSRQLLLLTEKELVAGRAFYKEGKLNIIIGDYNLVRNKAFESVYDPSGQGNIPYTLNHGYRSESATGFDEKIINVAGVENKIADKKLRLNWFVIDVKAAADAVIAEKNAKGKSSQGVNDEAIRQEADRLARERRQLRLEMAKMRKEMQEGTNKEQLTIEERLARLEELREQKLVTEAEYEQKRKEILDDI